MIPQDIQKLLENRDPNRRIMGYARLWDSRDTVTLSESEFDFLDSVSMREPDSDVVVKALGIVEALRRWRPTALQERILRPFSHPAVSAILASCHHEYIPDADPLIALAQHLGNPKSVKFHLVPFHQLTWNQPEIGTLDNLCFVGQPRMHRSFALKTVIEDLTAELRLGFPEGNNQWWKATGKHQGVAVRWEGQQIALRQKWEIKATRAKPGTRIDYAVVQRFPLHRGTRSLTVLILAGGTSLGSVGAVRWLTKHRDERFGVGIASSSKVEVLLKVTADMHKPRQPWDPKDIVVEKLFIDESNNLAAKKIDKITLVGARGGPDRVTSVLFDEDGVALEREDRAALIALCFAARAAKQGGANGPSVDPSALRTAGTFWPSAYRPNVRETKWSDSSFRQFFNDHFMKPGALLHGTLHFAAKQLRLDCAVNLA
jgi:hypothetical protein